MKLFRNILILIFIVLLALPLWARETVEFGAVQYTSGEELGVKRIYKFEEDNKTVKKVARFELEALKFKDLILLHDEINSKDNIIKIRFSYESYLIMYKDTVIKIFRNEHISNRFTSNIKLVSGTIRIINKLHEGVEVHPTITTSKGIISNITGELLVTMDGDELSILNIKYKNQFTSTDASVSSEALGEKSFFVAEDEAKLRYPEYNEIFEIHETYPPPRESYFHEFKKKHKKEEKVKEEEELPPRHTIAFGLLFSQVILHPDADRGKYLQTSAGGAKLQYTYAFTEKLRLGIFINSGELDGNINNSDLENSKYRNEYFILSLIAARKTFWDIWALVLFGRSELEFENYNDNYRTMISYEGYYLGLGLEKEWHLWWKLFVVANANLEYLSLKKNNNDYSSNTSVQQKISAERYSLGISLAIKF